MFLDSFISNVINITVENQIFLIYKLIKLRELLLADINSKQEQPPDVFCKQSILKNFTKFTGKHLWQSLFKLNCRSEPCNFINRETLSRFSCEFYKFFKNAFLTERPRVSASIQKDLHSRSQDPCKHQRLRVLQQHLL